MPTPQEHYAEAQQLLAKAGGSLADEAITARSLLEAAAALAGPPEGDSESWVPIRVR